MGPYSEFIVYAIPALLIWTLYLGMRKKAQKQNQKLHQEVREAGLTEPASLHPIVDPSRCIGCASCVLACPESGHKVLGLIEGKMALINPTHCIGHGACKAACPVDAISLVFGTARRGVDIPFVSPAFETNVPGIFIAGELGGMGLIRNAIEQGKQAMDSIRKLDGLKQHDLPLDVLIIGAGPAGIAASLAAMQHKLRFRTVEQDSLGGTVFGFPRGKIVMTAPADLPIVGKVSFTETTKEKLLEFWQDIVDRTGLEIGFRERVETVTRAGDGFVVKTTRDSYQARTVLLAIGRRGTPRKLGVEGEDQEKVVYRLLDPEQYRGMQVLVVGGGDSALEAATSIAGEAGTTVTLSYRSEAFGRAKAKNRDKVAAMAEAGRLKLLMKSNVKSIGKDNVIIDQDGELHDIPNQAVIVCAGGILPTPFLKEIGIEVETKYGTA